MADVVDPTDPSSFDSLLSTISTKFDQTEAADVVHKLQRLYPTKQDSFDETDLYQALKTLYELGAIDDNDGDQKVLEILAKKASKGEEILKLISVYKERVASLCKDDFVGRDADVNDLKKLVTVPSVPGVNVFGDSGVGKTTLAKVVSKKLAKNEDYIPFIIDLRGTKDINTVYFKVLEALNLTPWDYSKERIYTYLHNLTTQTLLILDSIEQFLSSEKEVGKRRKEFLEFLRTIMSSEANQKGSLKVILTSTKKIDDPMLNDIGFEEVELKPLTAKASRTLISGKTKDETADDEQEKALVEIADLCRNTPYLLERAEQLLRQNYSKPSQVLAKLNTIKDKGVPEQFACISALFDYLPSDKLREVSVKISILQRPLSVYTAMEIAELKYDDAELDLEMLAIHKIITAAEDVNGERKYDLHALFRQFVTSYLCKDSVYKDAYEKAEEQFTEHFSKRFIQLAKNFDIDFVSTYQELEQDKANLELWIDLTIQKETLDLILQSDDVKLETGSVAILFDAFKSIKETRKLLGEWAEIVEKKGNWLSSANFRCWESIQLADMEETQSACEALRKAEMSLAKAMLILTPEEVRTVKGLCKYCSGRIKCMSSANLIDESSKVEKQRLLDKALLDLKQSLAIHEEVYGDHTLTARTLNLIGNCYMEHGEPKEALEFYQEAMDMKIKLVGSEKHFDILTYYNQLSQVYEALGKNERTQQNYEKAAKYIEKALSLQKELGVNDTVNTAIFQGNLAHILLGLGKYDKALEYAQKSFEIKNTHLGEHPKTVRMLYLIGVIHERKEHIEAALESYEKAFVIEESLPKDNHSVVRKLLCGRLGLMCKKLNKKDKLKEYRPRMDNIRKETDPDAGKGDAAAKKTKADAGGDAAAKETEADVGGDAAAKKTEADAGGDAAAKKTEADAGEGDAAAKKTKADAGEGDATAMKKTEADAGGDAAAKKTEADAGEGDATAKKTEANVGGEGTNVIKLDKNESYYGFSSDYFFIDVPPNAVNTPVNVKYKVDPCRRQSPMAGITKSVSYFLEMSSSTIEELNVPITVTLMHSGPGKEYGYETAVMAFNQDKYFWEEIKGILYHDYQNSHPLSCGDW